MVHGSIKYFLGALMKRTASCIAITLAAISLAGCVSGSANTHSEGKAPNQSALAQGVNAAQSGDYATALAELTPLAAHGNAIAQYNLGRMYYFGQGVPRDLDQAISLFRESAAQGNSDGENNLGA